MVITQTLISLEWICVLALDGIKCTHKNTQQIWKLHSMKSMHTLNSNCYIVVSSDSIGTKGGQKKSKPFSSHTKKNINEKIEFWNKTTKIAHHSNLTNWPRGLLPLESGIREKVLLNAHPISPFDATIVPTLDYDKKF